MNTPVNRDSKPSRLKWIITWAAAQLVANSPWLTNQYQASKNNLPIRPPQGAELILACIGFLAPFLAAFCFKVWKELEEDAVRGAAIALKSCPKRAFCILKRGWNAINGLIWNRFRWGNFTSWYLAELRYKHGLFNDKGLGLINANRLDLERVYVQLKASADVRLNRPNLNPVAKDIHETAPFWDHLQALRPGFALVVIGPPGSGKTTLLQHVLLTFANNRQYSHRMRARIPFFIEVRKLAKLLDANDIITLPEVLESILKEDRQTADIAKQLPSGWLAKHLQSGRCILLWDGLDEVADSKLRTKVSKWLDGIVTRAEWRENISIVAARPAGYRTAQLEWSRVVEVQPFTFEDTERFISQWYHATEVVSSGNRDDKSVRRRAADETHALVVALTDNPRLSDLTCNPLLLTMICMVQRYHGALPGSRSQLYEEICQVLLERWRQQRGVKDFYSGTQKLLVLRPLAAWMMEFQVKDIMTDALLTVIAEPLARIGVGSSRDSALAFLRQLQEGSGLLLERELDTWSFAHLSFQEFLCADEWATRPGATPTDWNRKVTTSWWREVILLYAGRTADAAPLVKAALDEGSTAALSLVMRMHGEKLNLDIATRQRVEQAVVSGLSSRDNETFHAAGEAWVHYQQEANYHRLDDVREISGLVTQAEFKMFLSSNPHHGPLFEYCLDNWKDGWFHGEATSPILGVPLQLARSYVNFLNTSFVNFTHRLPLPTECETGRTGLAWCENDGLVSLHGDSPAEVMSILALWMQQNYVTLEIRNVLNIMSLDIFSQIDVENANGHVLEVDNGHNDSIKRISYLLSEVWHRIHTFDSPIDDFDELIKQLARTLAVDYRKIRDIARPNFVIDPSRAEELARYLLNAIDLDSVAKPLSQLTLAQQKAELSRRIIASGPEGRRVRCALPLLSLMEQNATHTTKLIAYSRFWLHCFAAIRELDKYVDFSDIDRLETVMRILLARANGELPAWESIRIVRLPRT